MTGDLGDGFAGRGTRPLRRGTRGKAAGASPRPTGEEDEGCKAAGARPRPTGGGRWAGQRNTHAAIPHTRRMNPFVLYYKCGVRLRDGLLHIARQIEHSQVSFEYTSLSIRTYAKLHYHQETAPLF